MIYLLAEDKGCTVGRHFLEAGPDADSDDSQAPLRIVTDQFVGFHNTKASSSRKRRVRFSETIVCRPVPNCIDFPAEDRRQLWNTPEDVSRIQVHNRGLVCRALKGEKIDESIDTLRGLEKQLRGNKPSRRYQESIVVVMETQYELWDDEDTEERLELISSLYGAISLESASEALLIGKRDESEAR